MDLLSSLPDDILILLLSQWVETFHQLSAMDIALCNMHLRSKYVRCLQYVDHIHSGLFITTELMNDIHAFLQ